MDLKPIKANMTEINVGTKSVLFSYKTPVAYFDYSNGAGNGVYYKTNKFWSRTTSRHINSWLNGNQAKEIEQSALDNLLSEVK